MASIRERGPYQWEVRVRRRGYKPQSTTKESYEEAVAWALTIESEMVRGVFRDRREAESTTLRNALERYEEEVSKHKRGHRQERGRIAFLRDHAIGYRFLAQIRGVDIAKFVKERREVGMSGSSINKELALISHLYNVAREEWGMETLENPVNNVRRPKNAPGRDRRLNPEREEATLPDGTTAMMSEEDRLLAAAESYGRSKMRMGVMKRLIVFALETAMRRGEIVTLTPEQIDFRRGVVRLDETKNGDAREVPLSPLAARALEEQLQHREAAQETREERAARTGKAATELSPTVFGLTDYAASQAFARICAIAGIKGLTLHDLRHEATSRLFEGDLFSTMEIAAITGHKTLQVLKSYTHLRADRLAAKMGHSSPDGEADKVRSSEELAKRLRGEGVADVPASEDGRLELTERQAIELSLSGFWRGLPARDLTAWQLSVDRMVVPMEVFHAALEEALARRVQTYELVNPPELRRELLGARGLSRAEVLAIMPPAAREIVGRE